jgi:hypothetical protein
MLWNWLSAITMKSVWWCTLITCKVDRDQRSASNEEFPNGYMVNSQTKATKHHEEDETKEWNKNCLTAGGTVSPTGMCRMHILWRTIFWIRREEVIVQCTTFKIEKFEFSCTRSKILIVALWYKVDSIIFRYVGLHPQDYKLHDPANRKLNCEMQRYM